MKILHLIQKSQLRGAEIFASQLASHLNRSGNKAIIVCLFEGKAELPFTGDILFLNGNQKSRLYDLKAWKKLSQIIASEKPDIIQANAGDTLKYAVFSKLIYRWKQPIVFRNASTISLYIKTQAQKIWSGFLFRFTQKIISVSNASALDFAKLFPKCKDKIATIPIGIEQIEIPVKSNGSLRKSAHLQTDGPVIIHVGGFTFEKNHRGLIDIFELIAKKIPSAKLYLVGDGPLRTEIEDVVRAKSLESKIKFYGFRSNALQYISRAHVLVLPSIIEGLPGVILEAFYCKIPVVAYDVGGINEIVINNRTGRLIKSGDMNAFVSGVLDALSKDAYNEKLIENAYALVTSKYLNTQIANQFLSVYKLVAS